MYLQKVIRKKQDPDPDPLVRGMDPRIRIRIHTKMSWIRNTAVTVRWANTMLAQHRCALSICSIRKMTCSVRLA